MNFAKEETESFSFEKYDENEEEMLHQKEIKIEDFDWSQQENAIDLDDI